MCIPIYNIVIPVVLHQKRNILVFVRCKFSDLCSFRKLRSLLPGFASASGSQC